MFVYIITEDFRIMWAGRFGFTPSKELAIQIPSVVIGLTLSALQEQGYVAECEML